MENKNLIQATGRRKTSIAQIRLSQNGEVWMGEIGAESSACSTAGARH